MTFEQKAEQKDQRAFKTNPLKRLNKAQTKRLEQAYFAMLAEEEEREEEKEFVKMLGNY